MPLLGASAASSTAILVVEPPTGIDQVVENPLGLTNPSPVGTLITPLTLIGGRANGSWSRVSGFSKFGISGTSGRTINAQVVTAISGAGDNGAAQPLLVEYSEVGLADPLQISLSVSVANPPGGLNPPTSITQGTANPLVIQSNAALNTVLTNLSAVGGNGDGTWAKTAGSAKLSLNTTGPARTVSVILDTLWVSGDVGTDKTASFTYTEGIVTLSITITYEVRNAAATGLTETPESTTSNRIDIVQNSPDNTLIATIAVVGGQGNGTFSKTGFSKTVLSGTGRSRTLRTEGALAVGDQGSRDVVVSYSGDGLTTSLQVTVNINVSAAPATPGGNSTDDFFWLSGTAPKGDNESNYDDNVRIGNWRGRPVTCAVIFTGSNENTWAETVTTGGDKYDLIRKYCENGVLPIIAIPQNVRDDLVATPGNTIEDNRFKKVNNGTHDAAITACARRIKAAATCVLNGTGAAALRPVVLRIGHEMTQGFPWGIRRIPGLTDNGGGNNMALLKPYRDSWNRVAGLFHDEMPNAFYDQCFQKDYAVYASTGEIFAGKTSSDHAVVAYRNQIFITHITVDFYDSNPRSVTQSGGGTNITQCINKWKQTYNFLVNQRNVAGFGHLRWGVDEWGIIPKRREENGVIVASGGSDNALFADHVMTFFKSLDPDIFHYESYFRPDAPFMANKAAAEVNSPTDANHSFCYGSPLIIKTAFKGNSCGALNCDGGNYVGQDSSQATALFPTRYKALWKIPTP